MTSNLMNVWIIVENNLNLNSGSHFQTLYIYGMIIVQKCRNKNSGMQMEKVHKQTKTMGPQNSAPFAIAFN